MLVRYDPFRGTREVDRDLDRLFGRVFRDAPRSFVPALDVRETEDSFEVSVDLPGIEPGDVEVTVDDGVLSISGKREQVTEEKDEHVHRVERSYGSFSRKMALPKTIDAEGIEATFDRGVLEVVVPKAEEAKPRAIEVRAK